MALFNRRTVSPPQPAAAPRPSPAQAGTTVKPNGPPAHKASPTAPVAPVRRSRPTVARDGRPPAASGVEAAAGTGYRPPPEFGQILEKVQAFLVNEAPTIVELGAKQEIRTRIEPIFNEALAEANLVMSRVDRERMLDMILADTLGYGPIQHLLADDDISEIMVNGASQVYIERAGHLQLTDVRFIDDNHVLHIIERIVTPLGRRIDQASPMVDARLPDGSRVNAIIPPLSLVGPSLTIRKFRKEAFSVNELIEYGSLTADVAEFLRACVVAQLNIIVSGGTGSGKTTLLNVLSGFIPEDERIVTIEDAAELQLRQPHIVRLESRPPNIEGKGAIRIRDLFVNTLRMRPDRIVVGECRGAEALDMLQAMNTGHEGSLTTVHSNGPRDTLTRIETMVMMGGMELPLRAIRQQIAAAVDLVVHISRMRDGSRRCVAIAEVLGMEGDVIVMQEIFKFDQEGFDADGKIIGELRPTGIRPRISERLDAAGVKLPPSIYGARAGI